MKAESIKKYLKPFRIMTRWTTFNGAMQAALAVPESYDPTRHSEALSVLGQEAEDDLSCVYCGEPAATWDHLENNVKKGRFSGFGHRIYNLVPACRTCNERKGGKPWRDFLESRGGEDKGQRAVLLEQFSKRNAAESFAWSQIQTEFPDLAREYDELRDEIQQKLRMADGVAERIRSAVEARISAGRRENPAR